MIKHAVKSCLRFTQTCTGLRFDSSAAVLLRVMTAFLIGAGRHSLFQCTPGYVGNHEYRRSFEDYAELLQPLVRKLTHCGFCECS